jgi:hypothetical protein
MTRDNWPIINQHPTVMSPHERKAVYKAYLPILKDVWRRIEADTGFRWKATSYLRRSPSHHKGIALDVAPDISPRSRKYYAVYRRSDPVLYKREELMRRLQSTVHSLPRYKYSVGLFMEPDHIHIGLFNHDGRFPANRLYKWGTPKPIYGDTYDRMTLPLLTGPNPFNVPSS